MFVTPEIESVDGQDVGKNIYVSRTWTFPLRFEVVRPRSHVSTHLFKMKLLYTFLWCLQALTLTSAAAIENRDLASTILGEFESAASCAGCEVRICHASLLWHLEDDTVLPKNLSP